MSNIFIVKKGPPKKVNKPTGKVVPFEFRTLNKAKPLKLRFGSRNSFRDIL